MQATDKGHDDGGKTITRGHIGRELANRAGHLQRTGQPGRATRNQQRHPQGAARGKPGITRRRRGQAAHLLRKSGVGAKQVQPHPGHPGKRQQDADVDARALHQTRDLCHGLKGFGLRKVVARRVFPGAKHQVAQHHVGHINQHQADQNFIGVEAVAQECGDAGPRHAAQHPGRQDGRNYPGPGSPVGQQGHAACRHGADHILPLGADVPDVGAKAHRQAQRNDQQGRGLDHQLAQRIR